MRLFQKKGLQELWLLVALAGMAVVYTAPTKHKYGDVVMMCLWIASTGWLFDYLKSRWTAIRTMGLDASTTALSAFRASVRWHFPTLVQAMFLLYLWGKQFELESLHKIFWGWGLYITAFGLSARIGLERGYSFIGKALVLAGVVHLAYMYLDLWQWYLDGNLILSGDPRWGWLEGMKDTSRVGRKYLSIALTNMLLGSLILVASRNDKKVFFIYFSSSLR